MKTLIVAAFVLTAMSAHAQSTEQTVQRVAAVATHTTIPTVPAAASEMPASPATGVALFSMDGPQEYDPYTGATIFNKSLKHGKYEPKLPANVCDISDVGFGDCLAANASRLVNMTGVVEAHHVKLINGQLWLVN